MVGFFFSKETGNTVSLVEGVGFLEPLNCGEGKTWKLGEGPHSVWL